MRKTIFIVAIILAVVVSSCSKYSYESVKGDPLKTRIYTLPNGLKVYMSVNEEKPRIQTAIAVNVGGKNDPSETTGLAHYFEHLMFKGTPSFGTSNYAAEKPLLDEIEALFELYRTKTDEAERAAIYAKIDSVSYEASKFAIPNEYDKLMAAIGASGTNAYTSQDMTVYIEDIPANQIENWAKVQIDRFQNPVIRGFHTELETVYEEKNMSLTQDNRKVWEAMDAALFPNHPYGTQTVLGTQEHLKNPSIINIKNYHKQYYVPNNMAICVAGDFDPDEMIATIDKYFGAMVPNENLPELNFEPEKPITTPVIKNVYGLDAASLSLGWRLPAATDKSHVVANIASSVLYNGQAGLIDLDLNQQQKVLFAYGYVSSQPDYGTLIMGGRPKGGQSLEELRDLLLAEVAKLRTGDFDEALVEAAKNNFKVDVMRTLESNYGRVDVFINAFINGEAWTDIVATLDEALNVTKQDVIDWANEYTGDNNYAAIFKREGKDDNVIKVSAPKITPIVTNRDMKSDFLAAIQESEVVEIEPVFIDYEKDMSRFELAKGVEVLYKKNETNDLFSIEYSFNTGTENDPAINLAFSYLSYLGTDKMTAEEIASKMYDIACSFSMGSGTTRSYITIEGLSENMDEAIEIVEALIFDAVPNEAILANLKADMLKSRSDNKLNQRANYSALQRYVAMGDELIDKTTLTNAELEALSSDELLDKVEDLMDNERRMIYYGPAAEAKAKETLKESCEIESDLKPLVATFAPVQKTDKNEVFLAQYDAQQIYYMQFANLNKSFDNTLSPSFDIYNEYFGGGMNSVVFQEMREARGLAYSAWAALISPSHKAGDYYYIAFIATQNDKMKTAIEAFDDIINNMPESENAFKVAKEGIISRIRTNRTTKSAVLWSYIDNQDMGLTEDPAKLLYEKVQAMTLEDVKAAQQQYVKDLTYHYGILGDIEDLDMKYIKSLGEVNTLSQEQIFGY